MARAVGSPSSEVDRVTASHTGSRGGIRPTRAIVVCAAGLLVYAAAVASPTGGFGNYHPTPQDHERLTDRPAQGDKPVEERFPVIRRAGLSVAEWLSANRWSDGTIGVYDYRERNRDPRASGMRTHVTSTPALSSYVDLPIVARRE